MRLAELIDWQAFVNEWSPQFVSTTGRPALPTRLMASLLYLDHRPCDSRGLDGPLHLSHRSLKGVATFEEGRMTGVARPAMPSSAAREL